MWECHFTVETLPSSTQAKQALELHIQAEGICHIMRYIGTGFDMSLVLRKPVFGVSDKVPHKPGCAITEDG